MTLGRRQLFGVAFSIGPTRVGRPRGFCGTTLPITTCRRSNFPSGNRSIGSNLGWKTCSTSTSSRLHHQERTTTTILSSSSARDTPPKIEISPSDHGTSPLERYDDNDTPLLDPRLIQALKRKGITTPTPIQAHGIPLLQQGFDVMASSKTGSGKTLLFALPICHRLLQQQQSSSKGPSALILNPTRELALQTASAIQDDLLSGIINKHSSNKKQTIQVALATGGANVAQQRKQAQQCDILVATPGRLLQFLDEQSISLQSVQDLICDESDRMVDLGFEDQLRRIAQVLKKQQQQRNTKRRTVLCSATFPPEVQRIAADFLHPDYYFIAVGRVGETPTGIEQTLLWVDGGAAEKRRVALRQIQSFLQNNNQNKKQSQVIVFCNTKDEAEAVGAELIQKKIVPPSKGVRVVTGDKEQRERNKSLDAFRQGKISVMVATDVAARGLDVPTIGLVVQVDAPLDVDSYTHRVGRTGRAGSKGSAVALLDGRSVGIAPALVQLLQEANQRVPAWLLGMSYTSRARALEEEVAIAAGGGSLVGSSDDIEVTTTEASFSEQDFRSSAVAGSWGSERDTSYHDFDDDAYSSLEAVGDNLLEESLDGEEELGDDNLPSDHGVRGIDLVLDSENDQDPALDPGSMEQAPAFERQRPSKKLLEFLKRLDGTNKIGPSPRPDVLSKLSQRGGSDQCLRFEYLGMFPFEEVSELLMNRGRGRDRDDDSKTTKILMVAEKPSIAKAIADALRGPGGVRQKRGISRALPIYELTLKGNVPSQFSSNEERLSGCKVLVTSVVGHVFSLGFDQQENSGRGKDPQQYFHMDVVKKSEGMTDKLRVVDHLRALAADCDHLVLWLDCDAEGENIAHEVIGVTKRAMEKRVALAQGGSSDASPQRRIHRAQFSAITREALQDAFGKLGEPDAALSRSVDARQELDLRVGVALTRLLTWRCVGLARQRFSPATKLVSYGPCQTPALSFCKDRADAIEAFVAEEFWKVQISAKTPGGQQQSEPINLQWVPPAGSTVVSNRKRGRKGGDNDENAFVEESASFDKDAAQSFVKAASQPNSVATVVNVENVAERISAPLALNTVGLLAAGSKAMGMSPKKVMQVAEKLYSAGYISYPRTETTRYDPRGFDVRSVLRAFKNTQRSEFAPTASYLLHTKYSKSGRPPQRGKDAGDHPPITCLKVATRGELNGAEWRVYDFVVRTFLGSLSDDLTFTRQVAELELNHHNGKQPPDGRCQAEQIRVDTLGFAGACPWVLRDIGAEKKQNGPKGKNDPKKHERMTFTKGMKLSIATAKLEHCQTRPPPFLQEHELIELMDANRIGTDASMAVHVTNIVNRGYVVLCDETGTLLRPPRPPRPGQKSLPRQIGRYLVPTSLGIGLIDLFQQQPNRPHKHHHRDNDDDSVQLLARPAIRAQMEDEVKQIALGKLDKEACVAKNLAWFEGRYKELFASLSRERIQKFGKSLVPTKTSLGYWRKLGAFEAPVEAPNKWRGGPTNSNGKANQSNRKKRSPSNNQGRNRRPANQGKTSNQKAGKRGSPPRVTQ
ncbi:dependent RNA helicase [Seminavis robusta]|uniref:DNA topoisomerase n=1 Tax=Seminavis robusta TaxID=568900 RepID=A0A9N8DUZ4_9STRA|nr:dependent RNA helicase [Seminavis robusta]|eukprot:Sro311_g114400.1 dependent RNA helicase (1535) ;mRNA; r:64512-69338